MDDRILDRVASLIEEHTGLRSPPANRTQLRRALEKQARRASLDIQELARRIKGDAEARQQLLNAVMIGETYFFREAPQFRHLRNVLLPEMVKTRRRITGWSVSCSTGEEAVSLAVLLEDVQRSSSLSDFHVFATDINTDSLERLRHGVYPRSALRRDGAEFHQLLLDRHVTEQTERSLTVSEALRRHITPGQINFFRDDLGVIPDDLDCIFFRNTLLYAPLENREKIIAGIAAKLRPGGYLFLATSELPFVSHHEMVLRDFGGVYALQRTSSGPEKGATQPVELPQSPVDPQRASAAPAAAPAPAPAEAAAVPPPPVTTASILAILNGEDRDVVLSREDPDAPGVVARTVFRCYAAVNEGQLDRAMVLADQACAIAGETALAHFCSGWVHFSAGVPTEAVVMFERALTRDEMFWPARFYRGTILAGEMDTPAQRRTARREFSRCIATMDQHKEDYSFLLEGFSSAYFRRMCERWIEKTTGKEQL